MIDRSAQQQGQLTSPQQVSKTKVVSALKNQIIPPLNISQVPAFPGNDMYWEYT